MKTVFRKFAFIYLLIFLFSFAIIVIGVRFSLERYFLDQIREDILTRVKAYEKLANSESTDAFSLGEHLSLLEVYTGVSMWVIDEHGDIVVDEDVSEKLTPDEVLFEKEYPRVLRGEKLAIWVPVRHSLVIGAPVVVKSHRYAIFADVPMIQTEDTIARISVIIFVSLLFSGVLALVFIYIVTYRISEEIEQITRAASRIAAGEFDSKIKTSGAVELADLANAFNKMGDDLKKQEEARQNFVSSFSHDIRTPLTTIKGYSSGILDGTIDREKQDKYLSVVVSECDRLLIMVNNLLDLAKIESGELSLMMTDFDLKSMIVNVLDSFEQKIIEKELRLEIDFSSENVLAHGDFSGMQRVVYNLIDNATKFVNVGGTLSVKTELRGDTYFVGIGNTGVVLDDESRVKIWNRFAKLDASRGIEKNSSGLGLPIVREILKAHNQRIDVYSNEDIGVVFIFTVSAQIFKE
ncbi:MAG: HAMP domain-containing sensor histidine kinase [Bacillota bacterium]|nr:HAMP domain-containing sensor histidine kinase [Bacillota bacterium]